MFDPLQTSVASSLDEKDLAVRLEVTDYEFCGDSDRPRYQRAESQVA